MKLSELKIGEKGYIVKLFGYGGFRKRMVEMGFVKGQEVEVLQNAPLSDPVRYKIMGYEVLLRRTVADQIEIVPSNDTTKMLAGDPNFTLFNHFNGTINEDRLRLTALDKRRDISIALVGNPNCGKSTIFNAITGEHAKIGNYSGVTVDVKTGTLKYKGYKFLITDLPGTYSISAFSPEERLVRKFIVENQPDVIVNVLDSGNIERNMFLTTQLIDMNPRTVIALNFFDELKNSGDKLDFESLGKLIGIPIIPTIGTQNKGIDKLLDTVIKIYEGSDIIDKDGKLLDSISNDKLIERYHHLIELEHKHDRPKIENDTEQPQDLDGDYNVYHIVRHVHINYGKTIERAIDSIKKLFLENEGVADIFPPRYIAIQLLGRDKDIEGTVARYSNFGKIMSLRNEQEKIIEAEYKTSTANAIADAKYGFIEGALKETLQRAKTDNKQTATSKIDKIVTNKYLAYPVLLLMVFLMFEATFALGQYPMDFIEWGIAKLGEQIKSIMPDGILQDLIVDGIISGMGAVIVFLPNILILYFCMTLLDASGYMARAAFIMDNLMHKIGLHGRSFIPLMMGFGCNVPAIMATRTIENHNSRMITILISSLISCSARLPVFILIIGLIFDKYQSLILFGVYLFGIMLAAVFSKFFKKILFSKEEMPFVMELPSYRVPSVKFLAQETWLKGYQYLKKIGSTILVGSVIIWSLSYFPLNHQQNNESSYLETIGKTIEPTLRPLGFDWKISVALLSGSVAKEVIVSTLSVINNVEDDSDTQSISAKLQAETFEDGSKVFTFATCISIIIFVLIYFPCIATIAVIKQETGSWKWAIFVATYTIILAWILAFVAQNVLSANLLQETIVAIVVFLSLCFIFKKMLTKNRNRKCNNCSGC